MGCDQYFESSFKFFSENKLEIYKNFVYKTIFYNNYFNFISFHLIFDLKLTI